LLIEVVGVTGSLSRALTVNLGRCQGIRSCRFASSEQMNARFRVKTFTRRETPYWQASWKCHECLQTKWKLMSHVNSL
jgi:hypothetical protein